MTTPTHLIVDLSIFIIFLNITNISPDYGDLTLLAGSNLIDLDHLLSKPIYHPKRNPFKTYIFHKQWRVFVILGVALIFFRPFMFLGVGLLLHLFLDYLYIVREKV